MIVAAVRILGRREAGAFEQRAHAGRKRGVADFFITRDLVRDGIGVGMLPRFVADAYVRDGTIEPVAIGDRPAAVATYVMLYPSSGEVPRKVAAFRDFLVERLKHTPMS